MDGDGYRDMTHYEMQQVIWRKVAAFADYANIEQRLPNGKIADVFYQVGTITVIVEVKKILKQSLVESAWEKYRHQCDYLAIACPPQLVQPTQGHPPSCWRDELIGRVGIWWVDWIGITEVQPAYSLKAKTPGHRVYLSRASSPFTVIGSAPCTAHRP